MIADAIAADMKKGDPLKSLPSFGVRLLFGLLVLRFRSVLLFFPDKGGNLCGDVLQNRDVLTVLGVVLRLEESLYRNLLALLQQFQGSRIVVLHPSFKAYDRRDRRVYVVK